MAIESEWALSTSKTQILLNGSRWLVVAAVDAAAAVAETGAAAAASATQANAAEAVARAVQTIPSSAVNEACRSGLEGRLIGPTTAHMI